MTPPALSLSAIISRLACSGRYGGEVDLGRQLMSPQGSDPAGTCVPGRADQTTAPVPDDSAYTVSFSVATQTRPANTRGSP